VPAALSIRHDDDHGDAPGGLPLALGTGADSKLPRPLGIAIVRPKERKSPNLARLRAVGSFSVYWTRLGRCALERDEVLAAALVKFGDRTSGQENEIAHMHDLVLQFAR
jgi:hypothetical protein